MIDPLLSIYYYFLFYFIGLIYLIYFYFDVFHVVGCTAVSLSFVIVENQQIYGEEKPFCVSLSLFFLSNFEQLETTRVTSPWFRFRLLCERGREPIRIQQHRDDKKIMHKWVYLCDINSRSNRMFGAELNMFFTLMFRRFLIKQKGLTAFAVQEGLAL